MKKIAIIACLYILPAVSLFAQSEELPVQEVQKEEKVAPAIPAKYGYLSYNQVLENMTEYKFAQQQMKDLRAKYEAEAQYNEASFRRQFAEYLQGQKEFPQSIMLKRQRDLQEALELGKMYD